MIKNKRLSSMFALFSACSLMTVGFTSQAASLQPEVKTAVSTKENIASEIQLNALQAVPANIVTSANSAVDEEVKRAAEEAARREQEAREQAEREAEAKRAAVLKQSQTLLASIIFCEAGNQPYEGQVAVGAVVMNRVNSDIYPNSIEEVIYQPVWPGVHRMAGQSQKFRRLYRFGHAGGGRRAVRSQPCGRMPVF